MIGTTDQDLIILLNDQAVTRLSDLPVDTTFFKKLPRYQTLRMLLCKKAVLVEGDSDELIFQKSYMDSHDGRLPIEDGIDVISVKLTFKRFSDIAIRINQPVAVITDNDHDYNNKITKKHEDYVGNACINIFADNRNVLNTLEPQFADAKTADLVVLCDVVGINSDTAEKVSDYMVEHKTAWALRFFESDTALQYPEYISNAVDWCDEE